jgi:hypothetical protein
VDDNVKKLVWWHQYVNCLWRCALNHLFVVGEASLNVEAISGRVELLRDDVAYAGKFNILKLGERWIVNQISHVPATDKPNSHLASTASI